MLVYRYEHPENGFGPYRDSDLMELMNVHNYSEEHPTPLEDKFPLTVDHYFGFASLNALISWFDGFHTEIMAKGFKIFVYEIGKRDVIIGKSGKQLIFVKQFAKLKKILDFL